MVKFFMKQIRGGYIIDARIISADRVMKRIIFQNFIGSMINMRQIVFIMSQSHVRPFDMRDTPNISFLPSLLIPKHCIPTALRFDPHLLPCNTSHPARRSTIKKRGAIYIAPGLCLNQLKIGNLMIQCSPWL
jgi:hypothetical protein